MLSLRLLAFLGFFASSLYAQTTYVAPAKPGTPEAAVNGTLEVARSGNEVILTWTLPEGEARALEIYRNTHSDVKGRGRAGSPRSRTRLRGG